MWTQEFLRVMFVTNNRTQDGWSKPVPCARHSGPFDGGGVGRPSHHHCLSRNTHATFVPPGTSDTWARPPPSASMWLRRPGMANPKGSGIVLVYFVVISCSNGVRPWRK